MADTDTFNFNERREPPAGGYQPPKSALSFLGNGKGEWARWILAILGAAAVSYMTASAQIDKRVSVLESVEAAHFEEVMRAIRELREDIREMNRK